MEGHTMKKRYRTEKEKLLQDYGGRRELWALVGWGYILVLTMILVALV